MVVAALDRVQERIARCGSVACAHKLPLDRRQVTVAAKKGFDHALLGRVFDAPERSLVVGATQSLPVWLQGDKDVARP